MSLIRENFKDGFWTEAGRGGSLQPCPSQGPWRAWGLGEHVHGLVGLREHVLRIRGMGENDFRPRKQSLRLDRTKEHGLGHGGAQQHCVAGHVGGPQHHVREHLVAHCGGLVAGAGELENTDLTTSNCDKQSSNFWIEQSLNFWIKPAAMLNH